MKYDISKKPTKGAMRTLDAFSQAMFSLLSQKSFESVSIVWGDIVFGSYGLSSGFRFATHVWI